MIRALVAFLTFALASRALPRPSGCADRRVAAWLKVMLRPAVRRTTEVFSGKEPAVTPELREAFERHRRTCDESAHGPGRRSLKLRSDEREAALHLELKFLSEALPRALAKCVGPSREACVTDVREAFAVRERALRSDAAAARSELERRGADLRLDWTDSVQILDGTEVLDAYAKAFVGRLADRTLSEITVVNEDDFRSSWRLTMDIHYHDQNFEYLTRVYLNLYQPVTAATLAQVRALAANGPAPGRAITVNTNSLESAMADRRPGRDVTWLTGTRAGQSGVLDVATLKSLKPELRPYSF